MKLKIDKLIKFGLTGSVGFVVDFSITWLSKEILEINPYISNSTGFFIAVINNYILNKYWTFNDRSAKTVRQFFIFFSISAFGLVLNTMIISILYGFFFIDFYMSKLIATFLVITWNYVANRKLTFKESGELKRSEMLS